MTIMNATMMSSRQPPPTLAITAIVDVSRSLPITAAADELVVVTTDDDDDDAAEETDDGDALEEVALPPSVVVVIDICFVAVRLGVMPPRVLMVDVVFTRLLGVAVSVHDDDKP